VVDVPIDETTPIWERVFTVAPLVVVGTKEGEGYNLAPKHMVVPLGKGNYIGFVCTPEHSTFRNIEQHKSFTVNYVRPDQLLVASLAASPRVGDEGEKPGLQGLPVKPASIIDGVMLEEAYLQFECRLLQIIDGFGANSLIAGKIVAAYADERTMPLWDADYQSALHEAPILVYIHPGRFAEIRDTLAFPFAAPGYE
jgi:flavin reductase (DIM6/NTAB) family NADH-FMN oxidoreductase RutF